MEINCLHDNPRAAKQIVHAPASSLRLMHEVIFDVVAPRMNRKFVRTFSGFGFTKNSEEYEQLRRRIYEKFSVKKLTTACNMLDIDDSGNKDEMCDRVCEVLRDLNNLKTYQLPEDDSNDEEDDDDDDEEEDDDDDEKDDDDEDTDDDVTLQHLRRKMLCSCDRKNLDSRAKIKDDDQSRRSQRRKKSSIKVCEEKKKLRRRYEDDDEFEPRGSTSNSKFTLSFRDVEDMVRPFTGEDAYGIEAWTEEYEEIADMLNLNALQKLIFAKKCVKGLAKKFVQSEIGLNSWRNLKDALKDEFGDQLSGADIHKKMMSRKILKGESVQEYLIVMKEMGYKGNLDKQSVMQYVIEGLPDGPNLTLLYGCKKFKEFKERLKIYEKLCNKTEDTKQPFKTENRCTTINTTEDKTIKNACYNCGEVGHISARCKHKEPKCFKCNVFGHKAKDCQVVEVQTVLCDGEQFVKDVKIEEIKCVALIDTGAAVNIMTYRIYKQVGSPKLNGTTKILKGFGGWMTKPDGHITLPMTIDGKTYASKFYVADEKNFDVILGREFLNDVNMTIKRGKITFDTLDDDALPIMSIEAEEQDEILPIETKDVKRKEVVRKMSEDYQLIETKNDRELLVVPEEMETEIIKKVHERGHFGVTKCKEIIEEEFFIKRLEEKLERVINCCDKCILLNRKMRKKEGCLNQLSKEDIVVLEALREADEELFDENRQFLREQAKVAIAKIQKENKMTFDRKRKPAQTYKVNDLVAIKQTKMLVGGKFKPKFLGPYKIIKAKGKDTYDVEKEGIHEGANLTSTCAEYIKPWCPIDDKDEQCSRANTSRMAELCRIERLIFESLSDE